MVAIGIAGFIGDWFYLQGFKTDNLSSFQKAAWIFPFHKDILQGEAEFYIKFGAVNLSSYEIIKKAASLDPYSARLMSIKMQYGFLLHDEAAAWETYNKLKYLFPKMPTVQSMVRQGY